MLPYLIKSKLAAGLVEADVNTNTQPVIGIVSQAVPEALKDKPEFAKYNSYVMADYVQFVEGSGARAIPIVDTETDEDTLAKLSKIDGVLFPGGGDTGAYKTKARYVYDQAIKKNDSGEYFPLWGICLGFEFLAEFASDAGSDLLSKLQSHHVSITIKFEGDPAETKMFHDAGDKAKLFEQETFAFMSHSWGVDPEKFKSDKGLSEMFTLTSTSHDDEYNSTFASTMESPKYPF